MKTEKIFSPLYAFFVVTIISLSGCSKDESPSSTDPQKKAVKVIELTIANQHPGEFPMNRVINESWGRWLERESGSRIKLTILPAETAAKAADIFDAARTGIVDIGCLSHRTWVLAVYVHQVQIELCSITTIRGEEDFGRVGRPQRQGVDGVVVGQTAKAGTVDVEHTDLYRAHVGIAELPIAIYVPVVKLEQQLGAVG